PRGRCVEPVGCVGEGLAGSVAVAVPDRLDQPVQLRRDESREREVQGEVAYWKLEQLFPQRLQLGVADPREQGRGGKRLRREERPRQLVLGRPAGHAAAALRLPSAATRTRLVAPDLRHAAILSTT